VAKNRKKSFETLTTGYDFDKMEIPVSANPSADLYDMSRAGYDQGYTQQEVDGRSINNQ